MVFGTNDPARAFCHSHRNRSFKCDDLTVLRFNVFPERWCFLEEVEARTAEVTSAVLTGNPILTLPRFCYLWIPCPQDQRQTCNWLFCHSRSGGLASHPRERLRISLLCPSLFQVTLCVSENNNELSSCCDWLLLDGLLFLIPIPETDHLKGDTEISPFHMQNLFVEAVCGCGPGTLFQMRLSI